MAHRGVDRLRVAGGGAITANASTELTALAEKLGAGVFTDLKVGDHVVTAFVPSCGHCAPCAHAATEASWARSAPIRPSSTTC